jgi:hypothetical protein
MLDSLPVGRIWAEATPLRGVYLVMATDWSPLLQYEPRLRLLVGYRLAGPWCKVDRGYASQGCVPGHGNGLESVVTV